MKYFGGIEGGGTQSKCVICDENGNQCAFVIGLSTNHWDVGTIEVAKRIADMVNHAKVVANIPQETLASLGLSLSGCEEETTNNKLKEIISSTYPDLARNYVICTDTVCPICTISPLGGIVAIAGTGSNTLLRNPDGTTYTCGGFGHLISDEGSAFYISHRAMKIVFDHMDGLHKCQYSIQKVWKLIQEHFNVTNKAEMLPHLYQNFNKGYYSGLCKKLAILAESDNDPLSLSIFEDAGSRLALNILTLIPHVNNDLVQSGSLNVICVGSVWCSWLLLKNGFLNALNLNSIPFNINLVRLTKEAAFGACYMAADDVSHPMPRNYNNNYTIFYKYEKE